MRKTMNKTTPILLALGLALCAHAATYAKLSDALKQLLPAGQKTYRTKVALTKAQAQALNAMGDGDFLEDDQFDVYYTKNDKAQVTGSAVEMVEVLKRWKSRNTWVVGFAPAGTITGVVLLELTEKRAFPMASADFLKQYAGRRPEQAGIGKGVDAVSGATESCVLLSESVKRAAYVVSIANLK
jgi:uncharacterized protein with FMN-binding domain